MTTTHHWLHAFRLRTLPLALSSIAMGAFLARRAGAFRWDIFLLCVITTVFLQILSNLANDYGDSIHGADNLSRTGPSRAVQSGAISPGKMRAAVFIFTGLSFICGITLLFISFGFQWKALFFFLMLGILSIGAAISYTMGKKPYGYQGLGDLSVLIFFGFVGVMGSFYLFTKSISWYETFPSLSMGMFSMAVLNINNIRDIESDQQAGKFSIPVRWGRKNAITYHWILLLLGVSSGIIYTILKYHSPWQFIFLLTIPLFFKNALDVTNRPAEKLDPSLKQMAISTLIFVLFFGIGLMIQ